MSNRLRIILILEVLPMVIKKQTKLELLRNYLIRKKKKLLKEVKQETKMTMKQNVKN